MIFPPKVSIVIPCYNDDEFVQEAINSAISQTYVNKEIIVVDDGSNLKAKTVLNRNSPLIHLLITQENRGLSAARNSGIKASTGEFIVVLDGDDFFEPSFVQKAINVILKNYPRCKIVTCQARRFNKGGTIDIFTPLGGNLNNFLFRNAAIGNSLFKKSDWSEVGGYDEDLKKGFEDWEFYIRLLSRGGEAYVIKEPLFNYRQKKSSMRKEANQIKSELSQYIFTKNKKLYLENFDEVVSYFVNVQKEEKKQQKKLENSWEYRIGKILLKPIRFIADKIK